ncbi:MAG: methyltransferase domain-containing protein [Spirochaetales bacterium]|nr:methyltransferase domain-containing protein [Leptospiraceae bacterium]MCP5481569.1 methyltransferase domain-containing protein [Spirochaetales bacterium]MCP5484397.1 methyltransferase domain-containing protein [Spirochaetales bacterium]
MLLERIMRLAGTSIPEQLEKPQGWIGRFITTRWLDRGNAALYQFCLQLMEARPEQEILEVGFGSGRSLGMLATTGARVCGVDFSPDMIRKATRINRAQVRAGRIRVELAGVSALPYPDSTFDSVLTTNTIYFWPDPARDSLELLRVLKPGARLFLGYRPKEILEKIPVLDNRFRLYTHDDVRSLFDRHGATTQIRERAEPTGFDSYCAIVQKAG